MAQLAAVLLVIGRQFAGPVGARTIPRVVRMSNLAESNLRKEGMLHRDVKPANILLTLTAPPVLKLATGQSKLLVTLTVSLLAAL